MNVSDKKEIVAELSEKFKKSKIVVLTDYKGLNVSMINELRKRLRESEIEFKVVKNTLLIRASQDTEVSLISDKFKGPSAIAISYSDPVAPAKVLTQYAKENDKLEIKAGVLNGKVLDFAALKALSDLPSREVLLAKLLSTMNAVPTGFVTALSDLPRRMLNVLTAIRDQKESA
jgi:large subunit ribosomal protein L10